jgi:hypothetical protein
MDNHDQALEARARELLIREYVSLGYGDFIGDATDDAWMGDGEKIAIRAIVAALREGQKVSNTIYAEAYMSGRADGALNAIPEGFALVPVDPTSHMLESAGTVDGYNWEDRKTSDIDHTYWWKSMIAAAITPTKCTIQHIEPEK